MAIEEMFTQLPTVATAQLTDIICAVQGYSSPSVLGLSVQESLQQVYNLFQSNIILYNAGNPNGVVAGTTYQFCWDTTDNELYICTTSGTASTAVWTLIANINPISFKYNYVLSSPYQMAPNNGYIVTLSSLCTLIMPTNANFGDKINVMGNGVGGWEITQNAGQQIRIGSEATTTGTGGSLSSSNHYDSIELVCIGSPNAWQVNVAPQGNISIV